ncbi:MAG: hypothetical protein FWG10_09360 [Eubacteriaceae bacterium]|nr:hypothetical protein [Eubacteriaceae bacterium]
MDRIFIENQLDAAIESHISYTQIGGEFTFEIMARSRGTSEFALVFRKKDGSEYVATIIKGNGKHTILIVSLSKLANSESMSLVDIYTEEAIFFGNFQVDGEPNPEPPPPEPEENGGTDAEDGEIQENEQQEDKEMASAEENDTVEDGGGSTDDDIYESFEGVLDEKPEVEIRTIIVEEKPAQATEFSNIQEPDIQNQATASEQEIWFEDTPQDENPSDFWDSFEGMEPSKPEETIPPILPIDQNPNPGQRSGIGIHVDDALSYTRYEQVFSDEPENLSVVAPRKDPDPQNDIPEQDLIEQETTAYREAAFEDVLEQPSNTMEAPKPEGWPMALYPQDQDAPIQLDERPSVPAEVKEIQVEFDAANDEPLQIPDVIDTIQEEILVSELDNEPGELGIESNPVLEITEEPPIASDPVQSYSELDEKDTTIEAQKPAIEEPQLEVATEEIKQEHTIGDPEESVSPAETLQETIVVAEQKPVRNDDEQKPENEEFNPEPEPVVDIEENETSQNTFEEGTTQTIAALEAQSVQPDTDPEERPVLGIDLDNNQLKVENEQLSFNKNDIETDAAAVDLKSANMPITTESLIPPIPEIEFLDDDEQAFLSGTSEIAFIDQTGSEEHVIEFTPESANQIRRRRSPSLINEDASILDQHFEEYNNFESELKNRKFYILDLQKAQDNSIKVLLNGLPVPLNAPFLDYENEAYDNFGKYPRRIIGSLNAENSTEYFIFGTLGKNKPEDQPFMGATGFVYFEKLANSTLGYWLTYVNASTGKISLPMKPQKYD